MNTVTAAFTVFFDDPFWVGVYERAQDGTLEVCRIVYGAQPKDCAVYEGLLRDWGRLRFSPSVAADGYAHECTNPKRKQREIQHVLSRGGVDTKAQQALARRREESAVLRRAQCKRRREEEKQRLFSLRQQKKREKHKGR